MSEYTSYDKAGVTAAIKAAVDPLIVRIKKLEDGVVTPPPVEPPPVSGQFFVTTSNWNTKIPATASYTDVPQSHNGGGWINWDSYSVPLVRSVSTDPLVTITLPGSWGWPAGTGFLRVPTNVTGAAGTDGSLCIIDGDTVWDFWQFSRNGNTATCQSYAKANLKTGTGWGQKTPFLAAGIHASGSSLLAGLIIGNELTAGINHAVAVGFNLYTVSQSLANGAIASDGAGGPVPMGARFAIPRTTVAPSSLTLQGKTMWKALQEYGAFVIDTIGGDPHAAIFGADPRSVPQADVSALYGANYTAPDLTAIVNAWKQVS